MKFTPKLTDNKEKSLKVLFEGRKLYKEQGMVSLAESVFDVSMPATIDTIYERSTYGFVNFDNKIVVPQLKKLVNVSRPGPGQMLPDVWLLDFVADALMDFNRFVKRKITAGIGPPVDKIFVPDGLNPTKAVEPINDRQNAIVTDTMGYFNLLISDPVTQPLSKRNRITNVQGYVAKFMEFAQSNNLSLTQVSVQIGSNGGVLDTGLAVNIGLGSADDDAAKAEMINTQEFMYLRFAARDYGFMIDKNCPWRLVADLASPVMQEYMAKRQTSLEDVFRTHYVSPASSDQDRLDLMLLNGYNAYASQWRLFREIGSRHCNRELASHGHVNSCTKLKPVTTVANRFRTTETSLSFKSKIPTAARLSVYAHVKNSENLRPFDAMKMDNILRDAMKILKTLDKPSALAYINDMFDPYVISNLLTDVQPAGDDEQTTTSTTPTAPAPSGTGAATASASSGGY